MQNKFTVFIIFPLVILVTSCSNDLLIETHKPIGKVVNGQKQGEWKTYYNNGALCKIEHYLNDTLHGSAIAFTENGNMYTNAKYKNGELVDSFIHYFSNGNVNFRQWRDSTGKLQGLMKVYFKNGHLKQIGYHRDGKMDGTWIEYDEDGRVVRKNYYQDGKLVNK